MKHGANELKQASWAASALGSRVAPDDEALGNAIQYAKLVCEWSGAADLTALPTWSDVLRELMVPALLLDDVVLGLPAGFIGDLGGGSGAAAAMIALMHPDRKVVLLDARRKKVDFCRYAARRCGIPNLESEWTRVSGGGRAGEGEYGVVTVRAFGTVERCLRLAGGLLQSRGVVAIWTTRMGVVPQGWESVGRVVWSKGEVTAYQRV